MSAERPEDFPSFDIGELSFDTIDTYKEAFENSRASLHDTMTQFVNGQLHEKVGQASAMLFYATELHGESFRRLAEFAADTMETTQAASLLTQVADEDQNALYNTLISINPIAGFELDTRDDIYDAMEEYCMGRKRAWSEGIDPGLIDIEDTDTDVEVIVFPEPISEERLQEILTDPDMPNSDNLSEMSEGDEYGQWVPYDFEEKLLDRATVIMSLCPPSLYKDD